LTLENFIPEIWAAQIFQDFDKATIVAGLCNRDYEGEIRNGGDTVKITAIGPVTVGSYTKNSTTNLTVQTLSDAQTQLVIDQQKYFAFQIDDVDQAQQTPKVMSEAMRKAAQAMALNVDTYVAALYSQAGQSTYQSITVASTDYAVMTMFGRCNQMLSEADVPNQGRWMLISPFVEAQMVKQGVYLTQGQNPGLFTNGYLGRFMGFDVYVSNNLATGSTHAVSGPVHECMAGTRDAITLAYQVNKVEAYRPEGAFSDAVKGLLLYGAKVIQPKALVAFETRST
jgi:hypothetical protein